MLRSVRLAKRAIDVAGALAGLAIAAPLAPVIAAAIYIDSPGPIFYRQRRAGRLEGVTTEKNGRRRFRFHEFEMHKFRTMRTDAEKLTGAVIAGKDDPRITRVGKFLRKSRLDELPQFWDVLRGEMSLVGPRPERPELIENLAYAIPFFEERMRDVKPGITGLAQVNGARGETDTVDKMEMRIKYDLEYLRNWSLRLDLWIIFRTVVQVFRDPNAY